MPTFSSAGDFAKALHALERDMERHYPKWGEEIAKEAKAEGYRAAAADLGGDPKFSGWRPWLELEAKPKKYGAALFPTRNSAGPWTVAEDGRNTMSGPSLRTSSVGRTGRRKRAGVRFKRWNGQTAGKGTATSAQERFDRLAERSAEKNYRVVLKRHFD